jgi:hypothetical protein
MKNLLSKAILVLLVVTLTGCGAGMLDFSEEISNGYYYHSTSSVNRFIAPERWNDETSMIPRRVVRYKDSGDWVSAKRDILLDQGERVPISSGTFDYWLLNTLEPRVYGPYNHAEFTVKLEELGLPDSLLLK